MHKHYLLVALNEAWKGRGRCAPNPSVGAVAIQNNKIIAQAHHQGAGTPHAESLLLAQFPEHTIGITLYVTLEPCNHWGKTPPCVEAIIKHDIERVVYAYADPNPQVALNNTPSLLRAHGIEVIHYPMPEIDEFYQSYLHWMLSHRPWVTAKMAQSLDGKIAGIDGARAHLSNASCAHFTHKQRAVCDAILTTARTVNQDDPLLNVRLSTDTEAKTVAILDRTCTINPQAHVLNTAEVCHIYHDVGYKPSQSRLNCHYHGVPVLGEKLDLHAILAHLGALGFHDLWVEGGALLFQALHQQGLVNRTYLYVTPKVLGNHAMAVYHQTQFFDNAKRIVWQVSDDNAIAQIDWNIKEESHQCLQA